ncbi:MAG: DedA family protein [Blastochloris viridis]|uniref:DedA family protein n=1 Tax=Blastochloris viridis TaxID=1079 RepID=A0A6N4RBH1_BLAVI|nr:MAG: DedA family protein [Blastochloris viridis]
MIFKQLRRLYDWTLKLANSRHATASLFGISFAESSFFPIPPDVMLIPMCVANRQKALWYAAVCTLGSALGGVAGYAIGYFLFETIGQGIINFYGLQHQMEVFTESFNLHGGWLIVIAGFTPLPYKLITIASGLFMYSLPLFFILSVLSRGARFFMVAGLLYYFGEPIRNFIEKRFELLTVVFSVLLIGGFVALKYLL